MRTIAIVQARMGSVRFPKKVMQKTSGVPVIELLLHRLTLSKRVDKIVLATSNSSSDNVLANYIKKIGYSVYQGSEKDVLLRYYKAAIANKADVVVRITGDCPLIDPKIIDKAISVFFEKKADYLSNTILSTYPTGMDVEVLAFQVLEKIHKKSNQNRQREHVTPYIREEIKSEFKKENLSSQINLPKMRLTLDEPEDFKVIDSIFKYFHPNKNFTLEDIVNLNKIKPEIFQQNMHLMTKYLK